MSKNKMKYLNIEFKVTCDEVQFSAKNGGKNAFECVKNGDEIAFSVWYDFNERPLTLRANAKADDCVNVKIFDCRIELYVGETLCDEEWGCGKCYADGAKFVENKASATVSEAVFERKAEPSVLYTFENAEGWRPGAGVFVGDCMPYSDGERYHVIYLKDRHRHTSKWGLGAHQWNHISTSDFKIWQVHPTMVEITEPWEGSVCTGSHISDGGRHYLFYTVRTCDGSPAPIMRSTSEDGCHYEKDGGFSFNLSEKYHQPSARDPKLVKDENGRYHMFVTTSLAESGLGCLAHLVSDDLDTWTEESEPIYVSPDGDQPECPDYFTKDGYYYLIFSHRGVGHYLYSDKPFCDWKTPKEPTIPCDRVPKCAVFGKKIVFAGFKTDGGYAGTLTFTTADVGEDGELVFE